MILFKLNEHVWLILYVSIMCVLYVYIFIEIFIQHTYFGFYIKFMGYMFQ
jgi:hypothetical protein